MSEDPTVFETPGAAPQHRAEVRADTSGYAWLYSDNVEGEEGSLNIALTETNDHQLHNVDIYKVFATKIELFRKNLFENMTEKEVGSMTIKSGSFMWIADQRVMHLRVCTYLQAYDVETDSCLPCSQEGDAYHRKFGTFMIQQSVCQSCGTLA